LKNSGKLAGDAAWMTAVPYLLEYRKLSCGAMRIDLTALAGPKDSMVPRIRG